MTDPGTPGSPASAGLTSATAAPARSTYVDGPVSQAQRGLWLLLQLDPTNAAYNPSLALRVREGLDPAALLRTVDALARRHQSLRTTFPTIDDQPVQRVWSNPLPGSFAVVDAVTWSDSALRDRLADDTEHPYDLARGPLLRVHLYRRTDGDVLLVAMHHIAADFWSVGVLFDELTRLYRAERTGRPEVLPPVERSYADYVRAEQDYLASDAGMRDLAFWKERLMPGPPAVDLPIAGTRPPLQSFAGDALTFHVDADVRRTLRELATAAGATFYETLLAAFTTLLARYTRLTDVTVGTPTALRPEPSWARLIGYLVNPVVLRMDLGGDPTFRDLLGRAHETVRAALAHQRYPFQTLVEQLDPPRDPSRSPLFQVVCVLQRTRLPGIPDLGAFLFGVDGAALEVNDLRLEVVAIPHRVAQFDLTLMLAESEDGIDGWFEFQRDLFEAPTIRRLADQYAALLAAATADPDRPISHLAFLTADEVAARARANATDAPIPERRLETAILEQATRRPHAIAAIASDEPVTYRALVDRAGVVAATLRERGTQREELVGIMLPKGPAQAWTALGILLAGAAYLPLDPALPGARLAHLLDHGRVRTVFTTAALAGRIPAAAGVAAIALDDLRPGVPLGRAGPEASAAPSTAGSSPSDLAYVIYTSGSTGLPKGVAIEHRGAHNTIADLNGRFGIGEHDRVLALSSLSFDLSVYDLFGTLAAGGTIVYPEPALERDPGHWVDLIERHGVTLWNSVPALLEMLVDHLGTRDAMRLRSLRLAWLSGDWIPVTLPDRARTLVPGLSVISMGGATEASIWSIAHPIGRVEPAWTSIPYGRPLANQRFHVLDEALEPAPTGVPGELYIGGVGLARGYWRDPDRTATSFISHPRTGERLYRTGDAGRYLPDGTIEFMGRLDRQVKVAGYRIELGEIEAALLAHPEVGAAVVEAIGERRGHKRLAGYVVPAPGAALHSARLRDRLRDHLAARLPAYMVPATITLLDALPLSANGKVDRAALPVPGEEWSSRRRIEPPSGPLEERIAAIWSELLGVATVSADDDFFMLGGTSLVAVRLMSRLRAETGVGVPLAALARGPTLRQLAAQVARAQAAARPIDAAVDGFATDEDPAAPFPLRDIQHAYWLGEQDIFELGGSAAHGYLESDFDRLDPDVLERALARLVERHEALRAVVDEDGRQRLMPNPPPPVVPVIDLRADPAAAARLAAIREEMVQHGPRMDRWPPFDFRISILPDGRLRLHASMTMAFCDGRSGQILFAELAQLMADPSTILPPIDHGYREYVLREAQLAETEEFHAAANYWRARLGTLPPAPALPIRSGARAPGAIVRRWSFRLPAAAWRRFASAAAAVRLTPTSALTAAYAAVLARWSAGSRFTLDVLVDRRMPLHADADRIIGNFSATLLLEIDAAPLEQSFAAGARAIQSRVLLDLDHGLFSGVRVIRELGRARRDHRAALMPVVFASTIGTAGPDGDTAPSLAGGRVVHEALKTPQVWLDHNVLVADGQLVLNWDVPEGLFPDGVLEAMFASYRALVERLAEGGDWTAGVDRLAPEPAAERERRIDLGRSAASGAAELAAGADRQPVAPDSATDLTPAGPLEDRLRELWSRVLDVPAVDPDDDFFALGGDSVLAVRSMAQLSAELGVRVPLATVFSAPSARRLAWAIRQAGLASTGPLVTIQPGGDGDPLFCIHAVGGNVLSYRELARALGPTQPVYGLQARGLDGAEPPIASIDEMAAAYAAAIRATHPGPYRLLGWSMGGLIAVEVARRLLDGGADVAQVVVLDTQPRELVEEPSAAAAATWFFHDLTAGTRSFTPTPDADPEPAVLRAAAEFLGLDPASGPTELESLYRVFLAGLRAMAHHVPAPYHGPLTVVDAGIRTGPPAGAAWRSYADHVEETEIAADHYSLLTAPALESVAQIVAEGPRSRAFVDDTHAEVHA